MCLVPTRPIMASTSGLGSKGRSQGRRGQRQRAVGHRLPPVTRHKCHICVTVTCTACDVRLSQGEQVVEPLLWNVPRPTLAKVPRDVGMKIVQTSRHDSILYLKCKRKDLAVREGLGFWKINMGFFRPRHQGTGRILS